MRTPFYRYARTAACFGLALFLSTGCGDDTSASDAASADADVPGVDGATGDAAPSDAASADATPVDCGEGVAPVAQITGTEGLAVAGDGTVYFSQSRFLGRWVPGGAVESSWVPLPGAPNTVWGVAARADGMVFVATPAGGGAIYRVDTGVGNPQATPLYDAPNTGSANGLVIGPDQAVYYSDFGGGRVYRVADDGTRSEVTAAGISSPNGLLFEPGGSLLVLSYNTGAIWELSLDQNMVETGRAQVGSIPGSPDGIARDETGRYYITDNGGGRLLRLDSEFGNQEVLLNGIPAAANIAFRKDAGCYDIYVASSGALGHYVGDAPGVP